MKCARCGRENPAANSFCGGCGARLGERDARAYTPPHLAEQILRSRSALVGERKQVTILFADVKDSTELAGRLGPEAWHEVLDRFFSILAQAVHLFEGTINQFTGDGIMALFGAPLAHEDHALRACNAALEMVRVLVDFRDELAERGFGFAVRIGINSGEVVVGKIGDDLRMDYTAQGQSVAIAARVEELASGGQVYLAEETGTQVEGYFRLLDLGEHGLRGVPRHVRVFELLGPGPDKTRLDVARARGLSTLVGRERERALLDAALADALEGRARIIGLVGEPGVGKSRLCLELADRARTEGVRVALASCPSHGAGVPSLAIRALLRSQLGIAEEQGAEQARRAVRAELLGYSRGLAPLIPIAQDLLGIGEPGSLRDLPPERLERARAELLRRLVQAQSAETPVLFVLDDVHWLDPESERLLVELCDALGWTRTLLVTTARPDYEPAWRALSYFDALPLSPLDPFSADSLLLELLGTDDSLREVRLEIARRAGGNPFFAEEIVRELARAGSLEGERGRYQAREGSPSLAVPASVQAVLQARIDSLAEGEKRVLQMASVLGERFDLAVLARVAELEEGELQEALRALERVDLVKGGTFVHPITREVAYATQLREERELRHGAVARAIETHYADELGRQASLIAHHWQAAARPWLARRWQRRAALRVSHIQLGQGSRRS
jgi:class 3 adenylate cyclase